MNSKSEHIEIRGFKAYDLRGRVPEELNDEVAYRIGRGYAEYLQPGRVVLGRDIRLSSPAIMNAVAKGLTDSGVEVLDLGECGTEIVYFATANNDVGGGIMVTASHNPPDYNGMKFVRAQSRPISGESGLRQIQALAEAGEFPHCATPGQRSSLEWRQDYIRHLLGYIDTGKLKPLKIVVNAGNGGAGAIIDLLEPQLPFEFMKLHHQPDGEFPNGVPNPLLEENRAPTTELIRAVDADLGIAWDGDYDRCFFFDEHGAFIEGYYLVGLLAQSFLRRRPGQAVVHDPRLTWNTIDIVGEFGGKAVQSRTGHAFIKDTMRENDAVYGGEMSAHHYFRDFAYCDSGMIPWLLVAEILSVSGKPLSRLVAERIARFPASGEINRRLSDPEAALVAVHERYSDDAIAEDRTDGLSLEFDQWRFNLRSSNTEPLVRLNVESRGDVAMMKRRTREILDLLAEFSM